MSFFQHMTAIGFITPPVLGILAGKESGVVGIMIGMGVGLVAGGLAYYALKKTAEYVDKLEARRKSQSKVVQALMDYLLDWGLLAWIVFLIFGAALMASYSTKFIVQ